MKTYQSSRRNKVMGFLVHLLWPSLIVSAIAPISAFAMTGAYFDLVPIQVDPFSPTQQGASAVFLPFISNPVAAVGSATIKRAGRLASEDHPGEALHPIDSATELAPEYPSSGPIRSISCSTQNWSSSEVRDLEDRINLDANDGIIYPGALVQGKDLESGRFTPITIPRAGGTIRVEGLNLDPHAKYTAQVPAVTGSNVYQAVQDILSANVRGTTARASHEVGHAYSFDQMLFSLGIDGRYTVASVKANLNIDNSKKKNYVYLKFVQTFYDVIFDDPELATSVFRDGEKFQDPEHQIVPGNPPLYVQKVSYGRIVFLLAESDFSSEDVQASLEAAYNAVIAGGKVKSGLTYQEVMKQTRIYYYVVGGDAGLALTPISTATPDAMYDAVRGFISNKNAANYSPANPGAPIAYTLRYLYNRETARMSYSVTYNQQDCRVALAPTALITVHFINAYVNHGLGNARFVFSLYGAETEPQVGNYPDDHSFESMDGGTWHPIERFVTVGVNERDKLRIYTKALRDNGEEKGTGYGEWSFDTLWSTKLPKTDNYQSCDAGQNYCVFYQVSLEWVRAQPEPDSIRQVNLVAYETGKCADVVNAYKANGNLIAQYDCAGPTQWNQIWNVIPVGNDYYVIAAKHSDRCLDVLNHDSNDGVKLGQWYCNGEQNQYWRLIPVDGIQDGYNLVSKETSKCVDVLGHKQVNGAWIGQWGCDGQSNQVWILRSLSQ